MSQDGTAPADNLLTPLAVNAARGGGSDIPGAGWVGDGYAAGSGYTARVNSVIAQARRLNQQPTPGVYDLLVSDVFAAYDGTFPPGSKAFPCAGGDCSNWVSFLQHLVGDINAAGVTVRYDIWNEPDSSFFWPAGYAGTQYFQMWDSAYTTIRGLQPSAVIVGPSVSNFNNTYITSFLSHVKTAGTVPNYVNWHFSGNPAADVATVKGDLSSAGITGVQTAMNEYLGSSEQNAGMEASYLTKLAGSGISYADHAIWSNCCMVGSLDSTLVQDGSGTWRPTGQWWVYKDYADVTGSLAAVTSSGTTGAVAGVDQTRGRVAILLGDSAANSGALTLNVNGLSSTSWVFGSSGALLSIQRIPDSNPLAQPTVVSTQVISSGTSGVTVPITWAQANDAYFVTITPVTTGTTIIDGNATSAAANYFQYGAGWGVTGGVSDMYNGTANWSFTGGSTAVLHFTGNQVALRAVKDVDQAKMSVSVDGSVPTVVDNYSATRNASGVVWTSPVLDPGPHVLVVTNTGTKNAASSGYNIAIDRADVTSATRIDANATTGTHLTYAGSGWGNTPGVADMYLGTAQWDPHGGDTASLTFTGTQVAVHAVQDVDQGIMTISVDGGTPVTVDDYASSRLGSGVVWASGALTSGSHTVTITVTGAKNSASSGTTIALDSVDIFN
ncbi:hypothetical protein ACFQ9V_08650 [Leifsonia sp. NPDC056665]|uniref:hypothetical protein n=1 Tax=Leifsonia sp. NPDC056665 TaxID=3345901 RepID=UPI00369D64CC